MKCLSPLEKRLAEFCDSEKQAIALTPFVDNLPADASDEAVENAVLLALVKVKECVSGAAPQFEIVTAERRDTIRRLMA